MALQFSKLPECPQTDSLKQIASNLWRNQEVRAIWVEGSVALGTADTYNKHRKVLYRGLDPMVILGLHSERTVLLRLWAILASGQDYGAMRPTIHSLIPQVRSAMDTVRNPLGILGNPGRTREELIETITRHRDEVSLVGRALAKRYTFDYPDNVEETVRKCWREFVQSEQ